ncbi:E3 ubiquitin-protein ligase RING1-like [Alnus glutinosa]|uniref:E3 ubiquitin-protein ligase RING1-like n=1 Tax=Alnus glutinosa TaxID=3517 RepID=UPI002D788425|nr:E3 ubiquitin-protein ligase RING1-like [Alnus glutinosa]
MSNSGGNPVGGGGAATSTAAAPQLYFCHQCNRTVTLIPSPTSDLSCPVCHDGFLEELENPNPIPNPMPFHNSFFTSSSSDFPAAHPLLFSASPNAVPMFNDLPALFGASAGTTRTSPFEESDAFNPFVFLQNYLQTLGGNVEVVINSGGDPGFRGGVGAPNINLGDYFFGPGLEQLIQQLAENDPNRYGTPPASKSAIQALPDVKISEDLLASDSWQCAVCKDTFELDEEAKQMPCKHIYHADCILPWLELHNSCPVCRHELPTDDPDYEQRTLRRSVSSGAGNQTGGAGAGAGAGSSGIADQSQDGASEETPQTPRTAERRFRISLPFPWPFRAFGSPAETSNSGSVNNNASNDGEGNSGSRGNQNFQSETRQEDLD